jgi:hypothetical protein
MNLNTDILHRKKKRQKSSVDEAKYYRYISEKHLQPRRSSWGGMGLAQPSVCLNLSDAAFASKFSAVFQEHVDGFGGKSFKKKDKDLSMEWRKRLAEKQKHLKEGVPHEEPVARVKRQKQSQLAAPAPAPAPEAPIDPRLADLVPAVPVEKLASANEFELLALAVRSKKAQFARKPSTGKWK